MQRFGFHRLDEMEIEAGLAGTAAGIAKVLFFLFLIAFVVSLVMGYRGRGGPRTPPL